MTEKHIDAKTGDLVLTDHGYATRDGLDTSVYLALAVQRGTAVDTELGSNLPALVRRSPDMSAADLEADARIALGRLERQGLLSIDVVRAELRGGTACIEVEVQDRTVEVVV